MTAGAWQRAPGASVWIDEAAPGAVGRDTVRAAIATGTITGIGPWLDPGRPGAAGPPAMLAGGTEQRAREAHWIAHASRAARDLARLLRFAYVTSGGTEGLVQVPLPPQVSATTDSLIAAGLHVRRLTAARNVAIGLPLTPAGLGALRGLVARGISVGIGPVFGPADLRLVAETYRQGLEQRLDDAEAIDGVGCVTWMPIRSIDAQADPHVPDERGELRGTLGRAAAQLVYSAAFATFFDNAWKAIRQAGGGPVRSGFCELDGAGGPAAGALALPGSILAVDPEQALGLSQDLESPLEADETEAHWVLGQIQQLGVSFRAMREELRRESMRRERERWRERLRPAADLSGCTT